MSVGRWIDTAICLDLLATPELTDYSIFLLHVLKSDIKNILWSIIDGKGQNNIELLELCIELALDLDEESQAAFPAHFQALHSAQIRSRHQSSLLSKTTVSLMCHQTSVTVPK